MSEDDGRDVKVCDPGLDQTDTCVVDDDDGVGTCCGDVLDKSIGACVFSQQLESLVNRRSEAHNMYLENSPFRAGRSPPSETKALMNTRQTSEAGSTAGS